MIRILIVDDEDLKAQFLSEICQKYLGEVDIMYAPRLASAMLNLKHRYDLVLCDRLLGDGFADSFVEQYHDKFPFTKIIFYSADDDSCKSCVGIKCFPFDSVKGEILSYSQNRKQEPDAERRAPEMGDVYNKALCEQIHAEIEKRDVKIESAITCLADSVSSFKLSTEKNNIKVLSVAVSILLALVANFVLKTWG